MPIYEYECLHCGMRFDLLQRFGDPQPVTCPQGHADVHRLLSRPTIIYKGSGFYSTDHGRNGRSTPSASKKKAGSSKPVPAAESQPEAPSTDP